MENNIVLTVKNLKVYYPIYKGILLKKIGQIYAVDDVSFKIAKNQTVGLVGESGCGKTSLSKAILRLYPITAGSIIFDNQDLHKVSYKTLKNYRKNLQCIFQNPYEALNPYHTVYDILAEPFIIHKIYTSKKQIEQKIKELLNKVGLSFEIANSYPHEFSGGQRQRICIARAIALNPKLIICDEPVSALDVSVKAQILNLLLDLQQTMGLSYLFISHDLTVVKHMSDKILVMYLGKIVEFANSEELYLKPIHPYTQALISSIPQPQIGSLQFNNLIKGEIPSAHNPPSGCRFCTRCPYVQDICIAKEPVLENINNSSQSTHLIACHFYKNFL